MITLGPESLLARKQAWTNYLFKKNSNAFNIRVVMPIPIQTKTHLGQCIDLALHQKFD